MTAESEGWSLRSALLLQLVLAPIGMLIGWGFRHILEERQRAKMRAILQQDAQKPFASAPR